MNDLGNTILTAQELKERAIKTVKKSWTLKSELNEVRSEIYLVKTRVNGKNVVWW